MNFGKQIRPHMSHQDPMSIYYDPVRCESEHQRDSSPEYWNAVWQNIQKSKKQKLIMTDEEIKTQADYLKAMEICKQPELLDRLKDRYIEFLAAKVDELEKEIFTLMTTEEEK
tara:strand:+ start:1219 stop:1557 length:339 start_codon:yes stop_codon:yes gene_type:complete